MMIPLPFNTPERMVAIFKAQRETASPEMRIVLDNLIEKWTGWHATTFRFLCCGGYGGLKINNWDELYRECVLL